MSAQFLNSEVAKSPEAVRLVEGVPNAQSLTSRGAQAWAAVFGRLRRFVRGIVRPPRAFFYRHEAEAHRASISAAKLKQRSPDVFRF